ncbi:MAG: DUF465 domain-containing protein [Ahrensia sp.]|nr:DUF465 domain-containing protein [Ahrensia sp.]
MTIENHLESLKRKHGTLEAEIANVSARPMPDQTRITMLKREKATP